MTLETRSYDGSVLVNVHSTSTAWAELFKIGGEQPLRVSDLLQVLQLIEVCATTTGLRYDGSMRLQDSHPLLETHEWMRKELGKATPELLAIRHEDEDRRWKLAQAAAAAAAVTDQFAWAAHNLAAVAEHREFGETEATLLFDKLVAANALENADRQLLSREYIRDLPARFRGSKLAAGLAAQPDKESLRQIVSLLNNAGEADRARMLSAFITVFRAHLLPQWAAEGGSMHAPAGIQQRICQSYARSFWDALEIEVRDKYGLAVRCPSGEEVAFPLVGLVALLRATKGPPISLLDGARSLGNLQSFAKNLVQRQCGTDNPYDDARFSEVRRQLWEYIDELARGSEHRDAERYGMRFAGAAVAGAIGVVVAGPPASLAGWSQGAALGLAVGEAVADLRDVIRLLLNKRMGYALFVANMQDAARVVWPQLQSKVRLVWGRPLVADPV